MIINNTKKLLKQAFPDEDGNYHIGKLYRTSTNDPMRVVNDNSNIVMLLKVRENYYYQALELAFLLQDGKISEFFHGEKALCSWKKISP